MNILKRTLCLFLLIEGVSSSCAQQYYDEDDDANYQNYQDYADGTYGQDDLYANYADRQQQRENAGAVGFGMGKTLAFCGMSWFLGGKIHSKRALKKQSILHKKAQKELYLQYYKDVMALQQENNELREHIDATTLAQLDGEFEAADVDNDNKVSRAEFNMYKNNYLKKHPEMASQFPRFEDFDPDSNGLISKAEYDQYYRRLMAQSAR